MGLKTKSKTNWNKQKQYHRSQKGVNGVKMF